MKLAHRVKLLGAKKPFNFFLIRPPLQPPQPSLPVPLQSMYSVSITILVYTGSKSGEKNLLVCIRLYLKHVEGK